MSSKQGGSFNKEVNEQHKKKTVTEKIVFFFFTVVLVKECRGVKRTRHAQMDVASYLFNWPKIHIEKNNA